jgi:hypothetical protein
MVVSDEDLMALANLIVENIKKDFEDKHLSGNLINTMYLEKTQDGIKIVVPAEKYNIPMYIRKGVVLHSGTGSYASQVDEEGSIIRLPQNHRGRPKDIKVGNHVGYVEKAIQNAIETWRNMIEEKYEIKNIQE